MSESGPHPEFARTRAYMLDLLQNVARRRWKDTDWVASERAAMHTAVNTERALRGFDHVSMEKFMRYERMAVGHTDYSESWRSTALAGALLR